MGLRKHICYDILLRKSNSEYAGGVKIKDEKIRT